jgi:hypothetical protein
MASLSGYSMQPSYLVLLGDITGSHLWFVVTQAFLVRLTRHHCFPYLSFTARLGVGVGFEEIEPGSGVSVGLGPSGEDRVQWLTSCGRHSSFLCSFVHWCLTVWLVVFRCSHVNFKCVGITLLSSTPNNPCCICAPDSR